jgi:hypothetical protein
MRAIAMAIARVVVLAACFTALGALAHAETQANARTAQAAGGVSLISSATKALAVVTGVVSGPAKVDLHGWTASLAVDGVLLGSVALGDKLQIAWEELSTARRERFTDGDRILVVLERLPTQSLWRKRFPNADAQHPVFAVASAGDAFLRSPDGATTAELEHYLAMSSSAREGGPGSVKLAEIVGAADPSVAREALDLLAARPDLAAELGDDGAEFLLRAASDATRDPAVRRGALALAAKNALPGVREAALKLAEPGSSLRADAYRTLGMLGGVSAAEIEKLLDDPDADLRIAGAELAAAPALRPRLVKIARNDSSARVRLAVARALLAGDGSAAISDTIALLDDSDADVRKGVAASIGSVGKDAVEPLRTVVEKGSEPAALAAVYGLSRAGKEGATALYFIANSHTNEKIRNFAGLALGKPLAHDD